MKIPLTAKELVKLLKKNGYVEISKRGSHLKLKNMYSGDIIIVPMHNKDMKKGLENSILKKNSLKKRKVIK